jgi:hypothetical protein
VLELASGGAWGSRVCGRLLEPEVRRDLEGSQGGDGLQARRAGQQGTAGVVLAMGDDGGRTGRQGRRRSSSINKEEEYWEEEDDRFR